MGSNSSKPQPATAPEQPQETESTPETESGVSLAIDLQNKIMHDFQSTVLKEEWEKRQKCLLNKNSERRIKDFQLQEALKERMAAVREEQNQIQSVLNERADALQARFADLAVGLQHDATRLEQQFSSKNSSKTGVRPICVDVRTKLATCYKENAKNSKVCDDYVDELHACMQKRLLATSQ